MISKARTVSQIQGSHIGEESAFQYIIEVDGFEFLIHLHTRSVELHECKLLKNELPDDLIALAQPLKHLGISEFAWDWNNAIKVIEILCNNNYIILGGDVYKDDGININPTYDSWYYNKSEAASFQEQIQNSYQRAIVYINQFHARNGDRYYYSIVSDHLPC